MKLKIETSAGGIVFERQNGKILWLITKHSHYRKWTFPKGLIGDLKKEESKEKAALREVEEEGGVKARIVDSEPAKVQYNYRFNEFYIKKTVYYFLMEYVSGDPKKHDWEVEDAKFAEEDEVRKLLVFKSDKDAFDQILEKIKKL